MSKLNIFLIILLAGMLAFLKIQDASAMNANEDLIQVLPSVTPTPTPIPVGVPITIQIPKIGENGPVEPTNIDSEGKMLMPESWYENAWYGGPGSSRPGEIGNSVIAGHLDTIFGTEGHFFNLANVVPGDDVYVNDSLGNVHHFIVVSSQVYLYDQVPMDLVFGKTSEKHLNLITCTGWYNPIQHNYDHRLVVFTKLVE